MKKLVIFDFDDTIGHLTVNWREVDKELREYAKKHKVKYNSKDYIIELANKIAETHEGKEFIVKTFRKNENQCVKKKTWLMFPSMVLLLKDLRTAGYKIAIATGNTVETIHDIFEAEGLLQLVDFVAGMNSTIKTKPDAEPLELILERLHVDKKDAIFIGNSRYDGLAGHNAGIETIVIRTLWEDDVYELRKKLL